MTQPQRPLSAPQNGLTIEDLVDLEYPRNVGISQSGRQVVYDFTSHAQKGSHSHASIWIAQVGEENSARQVTSGLFNDHDPSWSPDEESVTFVSDRAKAGESSAIYSLSMRSGEPIPLTKADNKKGISRYRWSPDGRCIAFTSPDETTPEQEAKEKEKDDTDVYGENWEYNRLRILHVRTGDVTTLFASDAHVSDFAWKEDTSELVLMTSKTPEIDIAVANGVELYRVNLATKQSVSIARIPFFCYDILYIHGNIYFTAGVVPERAALSSKCVFKLSQESDAWSQEFGGDSECVADMRWSPSGPVLHMLSGLDDRICLGRDKELLHQTRDILAWDVSPTNEPAIVVTISSPKFSRQVYSITPSSTDKLCQLSAHSESLTSKLPVYNSQAFRCKAHDNTLLESVFLSPLNSQSSAPWPTFVEIHGGPYYRAADSFENDYSYDWAPYLLSNSPTAVLFPNYRGNSGRGDHFANTLGRTGHEDYSDVIDTVKAGVAAGLIDKERVLFGGWSQGGYLSYLAVVRNDPSAQGFTLRGALCGAGISDWDSMAMASDVPAIEAQLTGRAPWEAGGEGNDDLSKDIRRRASALWQIKKCVEEGRATVPVLIMHGEKDERVPYMQGVAFRRACARYGVQCEMVTYPREPHFVKERAHRVDMLKRVLRFVELHLHRGS